MVTVASRFLRYIPEEPMRGPDVLEVQRRLRTLGFYQGTLDSIYGRGTFDAVVAFQARRQLTPDGIVGPSTWAVLGQGPQPPALGDRGPSITIDLERRRLYFQRRNVPQRTYEVAVGAPASPTPVGRWVVVEKALNPGGPFGTRWIRINIPWGGYPLYSKTHTLSVTLYGNRRGVCWLLPDAISVSPRRIRPKRGTAWGRNVTDSPPLPPLKGGR